MLATIGRWTLLCTFAAPVFRDAGREAALGKQVWLKMECLQPTGSFKIRSIGYSRAEFEASLAKKRSAHWKRRRRKFRKEYADQVDTFAKPNTYYFGN